MRIIISQIAKMLDMSNSGCRRLIKRLSIPLDIDDNHPLALSINLILNNTTMTLSLKPLYSIKTLSRKLGHDKKTITAILNKANVPIIRSKRKRFVYLSSIYNLMNKGK